MKDKEPSRHFRQARATQIQQEDLDTFNETARLLGFGVSIIATEGQKLRPPESPDDIVPTVRKGQIGVELRRPDNVDTLTEFFATFNALKQQRPRW